MRLDKKTYDRINEILVLQALAESAEIPYNTLKSWMKRKIDLDGGNFKNRNTEDAYIAKLQMGIARIIIELGEIADINVKIDDNLLNALKVRSTIRTYKVIVINDPSSFEDELLIKQIAEKHNLQSTRISNKINKEYHFEGEKVSVSTFKKAIKALKNEGIFLEVRAEYTHILRELYGR